MAHFTQVSCAQLAIGDVVTNARTRTATLTDGGLMIRASLGTPKTPLRCVWHPSAYQDPKATRLNLVVQITPELKAWVEALESAVVAKLTAEPEKYGKYTAASIPTLFNTALKEHQGSWQLKLKITVGDGPHAVRLWDPNGKRTEMPKDMSNAMIVPLACARHVWLTAAGIGVLFEASDVMLVSTQSDASPGSDSPF